MKKPKLLNVLALSAVLFLLINIPSFGVVIAITTVVLVVFTLFVLPFYDIYTRRKA